MLLTDGGETDGAVTDGAVTDGGEMDGDGSADDKDEMESENFRKEMRKGDYLLRVRM